MQKIIKESNLEFKLKNESSFDSNSNNSSNSSVNNNSTHEEKKIANVFYYDGSKQKIKGKLFNVFVICTLSVLYIIGENGFNVDYPENNGGQNNNLRNGNSIQLNSIKETISNKHHFWFYFSKLILLVIFILIIPLFKEVGRVLKNFIKRYRIRNYFSSNKNH